MVPLSPTSEGRVWDIQFVTIAMVLSTAPIFNMGTLILTHTHSTPTGPHTKSKVLAAAMLRAADAQHEASETRTRQFSAQRPKVSVCWWKSPLENKSWSTSVSERLQVQTSSSCCRKQPLVGLLSCPSDAGLLPSFAWQEDAVAEPALLSHLSTNSLPLPPFTLLLSLCQTLLHRSLSLICALISSPNFFAK